MSENQPNSPDPEDPKDLQAPQDTDASDSPEGEIESVVPVEVLEKLPPTLRSQVSAFFASGQLQHPVLKHMTPAHLTDMISHVKDEGKRDFISRMAGQGVLFAIVVIALAFIIILVMLLKDSKDLLTTIITALLTFVGGLGLGKAWR